jgi:hypothetical protein
VATPYLTTRQPKAGIRSRPLRSVSFSPVREAGGRAGAAIPAIGLALDRRQPRAPAHPPCCLGEGRACSHHIHAADCPAREAAGAALVGDFELGGGPGERDCHSLPVVLEMVGEWEFSQPGQKERLAEVACIGVAVG